MSVSLWQAARSGNGAGVSKLISQGVQCNKGELSFTAADRATLSKDALGLMLIVAARAEQLDVARELIKCKDDFDVNHRLETGETALCFASEEQNDFFLFVLFVF
jgi:hypothetical protein